MKGPDGCFLFSPHPKMLENPIKNNQVLIISLLQVVLDLLWVIAFSHEAIGGLVDIIVAILSDKFCDIPDIQLIPIFFLIDHGKGSLDCIELNSLDKRWEIMVSFNEISLPFPQYFLFDPV